MRETNNFMIDELFGAVAFKDFNKIRKLLREKRVNVNTKDEGGHTILHLAIDSGDLNLVKFIVAQGADIRVKDDEGWTILHWAVNRGNIAIVKYLIEEQQFNINAKDKQKYTALHLAAFIGNMDIVKYLAEQGAKLELKGENRWSVFQWSVKGRNIDLVKYLMAEHHFDVNTKDKNGQTALHIAAANGDLAMVKYLVKQGADVTAKEKDGWTVLHWAVKGDDFDLVRYLMAEYHFDVNTKDIHGQTSLHIAAENGDLAMVKYLVKQGADITAKDDVGWTVLHWAVNNGNGGSKLVQYLIKKHHLEVNACAIDGEMPIQIALKDSAEVNYNYELVECLLKHGADVNVKYDSGKTPLHLAILWADLKLVKLLVKHGADVNGMDAMGQTPLYLINQCINDSKFIINDLFKSDSPEYALGMMLLNEQSNIYADMSSYLIAHGAVLDVSDK